MKKFVVIYLGNREEIDRWMSMDEATRKSEGKEGEEAWRAWLEKNKGSIVDEGGLLGKNKSVDRSGGVSDKKNVMTAYTIVQADSYDEAVKMFADHPHFKFFSGESSIEIMECLPFT